MKKGVAVLANRIRELRKEKGLTIKELSEELSKMGTPISPDSLSKYERELRNPKIENWLALADFFDVNISYLKGGDFIDPDNYSENQFARFNLFINSAKSHGLNLKKFLNELEELPDDLKSANISVIEMCFYFLDRMNALKNIEAIEEMGNLLGIITISDTTNIHNDLRHLSATIAKRSLGDD